jgi:hypothetical protein
MESSVKPLDPSPTPWDRSTWGFYCDACDSFFDLVMLGEVRLPKPGICTYWHKACNQQARYIGYDHDAITPESQKIAGIINILRQEFVKTANGAEAMRFEDAVHATFPFATDWIHPDDDLRTQG